MSHSLPLPDEIIGMILEQIDSDLSNTFRLLRFVNRQINSLVIPKLYRSIAIGPLQFSLLSDLSEETFNYDFRRNVISHTREVVVTKQLRDPEWLQLETLIRDLKRLDCLRYASWWACTVPENVLVALDQRLPCPTVRLEDLQLGDTNFMPSELRHRDPLDVWSGNSNVHLLDINIDYKSPDSTRSIKQCLLSFANLTSLRLRAPCDINKPEDRSYHYPGWAERGAHDLCVAVGDQLPPLRELIYETCPWTKPRSRIPSQFFNWSQMVHLELRGRQIHTLLKEMKLAPPFLMTLAIENFCWPESSQDATNSLINFISDTYDLTSLTLVNNTSHLPLSIFTQQGTALRTLNYYCPRYPCQDHNEVVKPAHPLCEEDLARIIQSCPKITSLTLNMRFGYTVDYMFLSLVAQLARLREIKLYVIHETADLIPACRRFVGYVEFEKLVVRHIAQYLVDRKAGCVFDKIEIVFGDDQVSSSPRNHRCRNWGPYISFTVEYPRKNADIIVNYENNYVHDWSWNVYFGIEFDEFHGPKEEQLRTIEKCTTDWLEWNKAALEAVEITNGLEDAQIVDSGFVEEQDDDMEDLFGNTSDTDC